jgi:hypothetical protein
LIFEVIKWVITLEEGAVDVLEHLYALSNLMVHSDYVCWVRFSTWEQADIFLWMIIRK